MAIVSGGSAVPGGRLPGGGLPGGMAPGTAGPGAVAPGRTPGRGSPGCEGAAAGEALVSAVLFVRQPLMVLQGVGGVGSRASTSLAYVAPQPEVEAERSA